MLHRSVGISYPETIDAAKDHDTEQGSGDRNKVGGFTDRGECRWYELDLGTDGKLNVVVSIH